jgi:hypothetical protein
MLLRTLIGRLFLIYIAIRSISGHKKSSILLARIIKWVISIAVYYKYFITLFSS